MTTILILEGQSPEIVSSGHSYAAPFVESLSALWSSVKCRTHQPYLHGLNNADLTGIDGVVFTGSGVDWNVFDPRGAAQCRAMETVFAAGLPVWGSCNGMQLITAILGGSVRKAPAGLEVGLARDLWLTEAGRHHPMMAGRTNGFSVPCIHRDEVDELPDSAVLLASNTHSRVQAIAYEADGIDFWGTQYHPELRPSNIARTLRKDSVPSNKTLITHLESAEWDPDAARALGNTTGGLKLSDRARELANWLGHVGAVSQA